MPTTRPRLSRFTGEERNAAVELAFGGASSPAAVADDLGVGVSTLYRWADEEIGGGHPNVPEQLLRTAREMLHRQPYSEISVEAVARAAGVTQRTAFNHFPTKRDLFAAAVEDVAHRFAEELLTRAGTVDTDLPPLDRLGATMVTAFDVAMTLPGAELLFRDHGVPAADDPAGPWREAFRALCVRHLREARLCGELGRGVSLTAGARTLTAAGRALVGAAFEGVNRAVVRRALANLPALLAPPRS